MALLLDKDVQTSYSRRMPEHLKPGVARDAIDRYLRSLEGDASVAEIRSAVRKDLGRPVARSTIQSHLNLNLGTTLERTSRGRYRLLSR